MALQRSSTVHLYCLGEIETNQEAKHGNRQSFGNVVSYLKEAAYKSYSSSYIIKWSFWIVISTCCNYQVGNYIQPLWEEIKPSTNESEYTVIGYGGLGPYYIIMSCR